MSKTTCPITIKNTERLQAALDEVQEKKRSFLLSVQDIVSAALQAERRLEDFNIPKEQRYGFTFTFDPHSVANAYRYAGSCTVAELRRNTSGWTVTAIRRNLSIKRGAISTVPKLRLVADAARREDILRSTQHRSRIEILATQEVAS